MTAKWLLVSNMKAKMTLQRVKIIKKTLETSAESKNGPKNSFFFTKNTKPKPQTRGKNASKHTASKI